MQPLPLKFYIHLLLCFTCISGFMEWFIYYFLMALPENGGIEARSLFAWVTCCHSWSTKSLTGPGETASFFYIKEVVIPSLANKWGDLKAWLKRILHRRHGKGDRTGHRQDTGPKGRQAASSRLSSYLLSGQWC